MEQIIKLKELGKWDDYFFSLVKESNKNNIEAQKLLIDEYIHENDFNQDGSHLEKYDEDKPWSQTHLGHMYMNGAGVDEDVDMAIEKFKKGCKLNCHEAHLSLGIIYLDDNNEEKAIKYFKQAAKLGSSSAYVELGNLYEDSTSYFQKGIDMGNAQCMNCMGMYYEDKQDFELARKYYQMGSDHDDSDSMLNLSQLYQHGKGISKDLTKSRELLEKSYELDNPKAAVNLAYLYKQESNIQKAKELYKFAIDKNDPVACYGLGMIYKEDNQKDKAIKAFKKGVKLDNEYCSIELNRIKK